MEYVKKYVSIGLNIIIPIVLVWFFCVFGLKVLHFFFPFFIGWVIALIANPVVKVLEKKLKIVRKHSSMIIVVGVLAIIIGGLYLLISKLVVESIGFTKYLPSLLNTIQIELQQMGERFSGVLSMLPDSMEDNVSQITENLHKYIGNVIAEIGEPTIEAAGNFAKSIPTVFVNVIVIILSSYFFIADKDSVSMFLVQFLPNSWKQYISKLKYKATHLVGGYFVAQFKIMILVFVVLLIGFVILDVPYAVLFAFLIAFLDFLPLFGTGTALIPWAVFCFFSGDYSMGIGLAIIYVVSQGLRQLLQPKIVGDTLGLNPLATLVFMYIGFKIQGIAGMILAVPVGIVLLELIKMGCFDSFLYNIRLLAEEVKKIRDYSKEEK